MNPKIEIDAFSVTRTGNLSTFNKYDIEVSLEEIDRTDTETKIRYSLTLLSNPKNARMNVGGKVTLFGNESETEHFLENDESKVPHILHMIYQELFPMFYVNSRNLQIPCPAYKLADITVSSESSTETESTVTESITESPIEEINANSSDINMNQNDNDTQQQILDEIQSV